MKNRIRKELQETEGKKALFVGGIIDGSRAAPKDGESFLPLVLYHQWVEAARIQMKFLTPGETETVSLGRILSVHSYARQGLNEDGLWVYNWESHALMSKKAFLELVAELNEAGG